MLRILGATSLTPFLTPAQLIAIFDFIDLGCAWVEEGKRDLTILCYVGLIGSPPSTFTIRERIRAPILGIGMTKA